MKKESKSIVKIKIEVHGIQSLVGANIHIDCPFCDNWEQLGIDDPRGILSSIPIIPKIGWKPDIEGENEVSIHKCTQCENEFEVEWDYSVITDPDAENTSEARAKELSLVTAFLRNEGILDGTLFRTFDDLYEIALAFVEKYGVGEIAWGIDLDFEETLYAFSEEYAKKNFIDKYPNLR